jgi:hypothetical protein
LLSERLKKLEQQGIACRRVLPPPAGSTVYELTPFGLELESALIELGRWGSRLMPGSLEGVSMPSTGATALAIKAFCHPEESQLANETYALHIGNEVLYVQVKDGELSILQGQPRKADAVFHITIQAWLGLFTGQIKPEEAISAGLVQVEGDPGALARLLSVTGVPGPA